MGKKIREKITDKKTDMVDAVFNHMAAGTRSKYLKRWAELSGVDDVKDIDYSIPQVHLEFLLADPRNLKLISGGTNRQQFLDMLTPEEQDIYLNAIDDEGARYTDLEAPEVMQEIGRAFKKRKVR